MEGNVVCSHLRSKFSSTLEKAEADLSNFSQIISRFRSIETLLFNTMKQNSGSMLEVLYDLMDALSECTIFGFAHQAASNKSFNFFRMVRFQNKMKSRLDKIDKSLRDVRPDQQYRNRSTDAGPVVQQSSPSPSLITGFESQVREIEEMILSPVDSRLKPIGIVGRCGSGKTALAQKVFASCVVEKKFFPRIWVSLSERLIHDESSGLRQRVLNHILGETGHDASDLKYGDYSVVQLLEMLRLRLMGKRYLIVLDDAWRLDEWFDDLACYTGGPEAESFTNSLPKDSGGAVIVTSRGENVIRRMVGEKYVIRPHLSDDICGAIFSDAVRQQGKIDPGHPMLIQMEESVISNCQGLPLAANTLANVISNLLAEEK